MPLVQVDVLLPADVHHELGDPASGQRGHRLDVLLDVGLGARDAPEPRGQRLRIVAPSSDGGADPQSFTTLQVGKGCLSAWTHRSAETTIVSVPSSLSFAVWLLM